MAKYLPIPLIGISPKPKVVNELILSVSALNRIDSTFMSKYPSIRTPIKKL